MLKYVDAKVTFSEVPDEISLCINISNCPCNCTGCHSSYLSQDIGEPLSIWQVLKLILDNKGITCIAFMGGDSNPKEINQLGLEIKRAHPELKIAWYSGRQQLSKYIKLHRKAFDYIKLGPYIEDLGPLNSKTTNQRFYRVEDGKLIDETYKFWGNN